MTTSDLRRGRRTGAARVRAGLAAVVLVALGSVACQSTGNSLTGQKSQVSDSPTGSSPSANATATAKAHAKKATVGSTLTVTGDDDLKASVTLSSVTYHSKGDGVLAEAPKNGRYVVARVLIKVDTGSYDFNPLYFKLQESDGTSFDPFDGNGLTAGFDPTLSAGSLNSGQKTGGNLVFDAPATAGDQLTLQINDPLGSSVGSWDFTAK